MATPHVTGAAALYLQANPDASPADVRAALTQWAECENGALTGSNTCSIKWTDDPDSDWEPLLDTQSW